MLLKLKKIFATDLVKVSSLTAVSTLVRVLTGFISAKIVAVKIGPEGVALLGQLNSFYLIVLSLSLGGISNGVIKHIAQYAGSEKKYGLFISTGFRITVIISAICGAVLIVGAHVFSKQYLDNTEYTPVFYVFGGTLILYAVNSLLMSVLNGFKEFKKYVTVNIAISVAGLVFTLILTEFFGIYGSLIALVTYQSVVLVITIAMISKSSWFKWKLFFGRFSWTAAKRLSRYSLMALVSAIALPLAQLIVRTYMIEHETKENAGLWEGMNRLSGIYLMFITNSLSVYFLPKISGLKNDLDIRKEVFSVYKLLIPALILISFSLYLFRYQIIHILFANTFNGMQDLFAFQMIGDVLKMSTWVLGYILVAKGMAKTYIIVEIASCTAFVLLSLFFINTYGKIGATMGYAVAFLCQLIIMTLIFRKLLFEKK
jgi:O-antigen/teichoic acid export membrane protein